MEYADVVWDIPDHTSRALNILDKIHANAARIVTGRGLWLDVQLRNYLRKLDGKHYHLVGHCIEQRYCLTYSMEKLPCTF